MNDNSVNRINTYLKNLHSDDPVEKNIAETELKKLDDINELIAKCLVEEEAILHEGVSVRAIDVLNNLASPKSDHQKHLNAQKEFSLNESLQLTQNNE